MTGAIVVTDDCGGDAEFVDGDCEDCVAAPPHAQKPTNIADRSTCTTRIMRVATSQ